MPELYHLESFRQYEQLHFYTLRQEEEDGSLARESLAENFFRRMQARSDLAWEFSIFKRLIRNLGNNCRSALAANLLHHEDSAKALPPNYPLRWLGGHSDEEDSAEQDSTLPGPGDIMFRLYCYPASDQTIILFNGDWKTARTPQQCPNVAPHFWFARAAGTELTRMRQRREWYDAGPLLLPDTITLWL
jgi:hypothetical protein